MPPARYCPASPQCASGTESAATSPQRARRLLRRARLALTHKAVRRGDDPDEVALQLERQDKANARCHVKRTVRRVQESLGLDVSRGRLP